MASVKIYDMMDRTDEYFVGTYTHMKRLTGEDCFGKIVGSGFTISHFLLLFSFYSL